MVSFVPFAEYAHALKGLALPRASHSSEIALVGSHRQRSTLVTAPGLLHTLSLQQPKRHIHHPYTHIRHPLPLSDPLKLLQTAG